MLLRQTTIIRTPPPRAANPSHHPLRRRRAAGFPRLHQDARLIVQGQEILHLVASPRPPGKEIRHLGKEIRHLGREIRHLDRETSEVATRWLPCPPHPFQWPPPSPRNPKRSETSSILLSTCYEVAGTTQLHCVTLRSKVEGRSRPRVLEPRPLPRRRPCSTG